MKKNLIGLIIADILCIAFAVYGVLSQYEIILAIGLSCSFLLTVFIPVLWCRGNKKQRITQREDALLAWQYSYEEIDRIATMEGRKTRKASIGISILLFICIAIIFAPFIVITKNQNTRAILLIIGVIAALLPFFSIFIAPAVTMAAIRKTPSMTIVGRDYILMNNRYLGINDRASLKIRDVQTQQTPEGMNLVVTYNFRMKYGNCMDYPVMIPVPRGREIEAEIFKDTYKVTT